MTLDEKFKTLEADNAPGQEEKQEIGDLNAIMRGEKFNGIPVGFSHGDVDAFPPTPGSSDAWKDGFVRGSQQAYTVYRGAARIREGRKLLWLNLIIVPTANWLNSSAVKLYPFPCTTREPSLKTAPILIDLKPHLKAAQRSLFFRHRTIRQGWYIQAAQSLQFQHSQQHIM